MERSDETAPSENLASRRGRGRVARCLADRQGASPIRRGRSGLSFPSPQAWCTTRPAVLGQRRPSLYLGTIVIENIGGAGSTLGTTAVARATRWPWPTATFSEHSWLQASTRTWSQLQKRRGSSCVTRLKNGPR